MWKQCFIVLMFYKSHWAFCKNTKEIQSNPQYDARLNTKPKYCLFMAGCQSSAKLINTGARRPWRLWQLLTFIHGPRNVQLSRSVITAEQTTSTFLHPKLWTTLFLKVISRVKLFFWREPRTSITPYFSKIKWCSQFSFTQKSPLLTF